MFEMELIRCQRVLRCQRGAMVTPPIVGKDRSAAPSRPCTRGRNLACGELLTLTRITVPKATSNLHSEPFDRLIWVGGAGANWLSADGCVRSRPGRDMALLGSTDPIFEKHTGNKNVLYFLTDNDKKFGELEDHY